MINKKKYSQYFTSKEIARFMVKWVMECKPKTLLDPAVGKGVFLEEALSIDKSVRISAFDVDTNFCEFIKSKYKKINIQNQDYLSSSKQSFDAIICNPPYNKFQKIRNRAHIINEFFDKYNIKLSGYSNLCIYFLIKSMQEVSQGGRCCYIIPYEFLNTNYGEIVKKYLLESKMLVSIIKFDNSLNLFEDAITTSCILLLENLKHENINFINIKNINELNQLKKLSNICTYKISSLDPKTKWIQYFQNTNTNFGSNLIKLKEIAQVKRGIATGNNKFFTLNSKKISELGLSNKVCLPCITKSADITVPIFNKSEFNKLVILNKNMYLFDGINSKLNNDFNYIKNGEEQGFDKTYLTSHRKPWYLLENKDPAPILLSVFSRNKIKVIRNEMMTKNLTTFHGLYFHKNFAEEFINLCFCYLLTPVAQKILFLNKREYGDGLDKFEPNDLNNALILDLNIINDNDKKKILIIYNQLCKENFVDSVISLDKIFKQYIISTSR